MKKIILLIGIIIGGLMGLTVSSTEAYMIDGYVLDWGIDLQAASLKGYLNTHLPSGGHDINVKTEDNAGNYYGVWQYVGPGYTYYGNDFDVEAIYFDNDNDYAYITVIQGLPITGGTAPGNPWFYPGDIGIDMDGDGKYEYGIDVREYDAINKKARLYNAAVWDNVYYPAFYSANPWEIVSGDSWNLINFVYSDNQNSHYVLEAGIPLSLLGLPDGPGASTHSLGIHWTMECGNDYLNLNADINPAPEPNTLILLGSALLGFMGIRLKRKKAGI